MKKRYEENGKGTNGGKVEKIRMKGEKLGVLPDF
jgi:hypothetical protein